MAEHHYVRHILHRLYGVHTEYKCEAPEGAQCRVTCRRCYYDVKDACICEHQDEPLEPDMQDIGRCLILDWLVNDAPEEAFNGEEQPIRGPDWQPIMPGWDGDSYYWDYAE